MVEEAEAKAEAKAAKGEQEGGESETGKPDQDDPRLVTSCWACGSKILLPEDGIPPGLTADEIPFECGGCGANNLRDHRSKAHAARSRLRQCCRTASHTFMKVMGTLLLVFVPVLIVGLYAVAMWNFWNMPVTAMCFEVLTVIGLWFIVMTLWTFTLAATTKAGSPALGIKSYGNSASAADGRLKGFSFCQKCEIPRARRAHHCSVCRRCIHDMDHHCPYINNCVGYYNRRIFVQFTMYASCACYYAIAVLSIAVAVSRDIQNQLIRGIAMAIFSIPGHGRLLSYASRSVNVALWKSMRDPRSGFVGVFLDISLALYLLCAFLVAVLVGGLFLGQLQMLSRDTTALEYSIMQQPRPGLREGWSNIKKTMGPLRTWLWPQRHPFPPELGGREAPRILEEIDVASEEVEVKKDEVEVKKDK